MSIEVILKAAEFLERRERGKRQDVTYFRKGTVAFCCCESVVLIFCCGVKYLRVVEAEHGYAMVRPYFVESVPSRRRTASTPARRTLSTTVGVRYPNIAHILDSVLAPCHTYSNTIEIRSVVC